MAEKKPGNAFNVSRFSVVFPPGVADTPAQYSSADGCDVPTKKHPAPPQQLLAEVSRFKISLLDAKLDADWPEPFSNTR